MQILSANGPSLIYIYLLWCRYSNTFNRITLLYASKCHFSGISQSSSTSNCSYNLKFNLANYSMVQKRKMNNFTHLVMVSPKLLRFDLMLYVSNIGESLINSICWQFSANFNICMSMNFYVQWINFMEIFFLFNADHRLGSLNSKGYTSVL